MLRVVYAKIPKISRQTRLDASDDYFAHPIGRIFCYPTRFICHFRSMLNAREWVKGWYTQCWRSKQSKSLIEVR